jgi:hypothetical protein
VGRMNNIGDRVRIVDHVVYQMNGIEGIIIRKTPYYTTPRTEQEKEESIYIIEQFDNPNLTSTFPARDSAFINLSAINRTSGIPF